MEQQQLKEDRMIGSYVKVTGGVKHRGLSGFVVDQQDEVVTIDFDDGSKASYPTSVVKEIEVPEEVIDKLLTHIDDEDEMMDAYDDDEIELRDEEGNIIEEEFEALNEVLSRAERMKARVRFAKTKAKRAIKVRIALKRKSDTKTINKRARRLAIKALKEKIGKKKLSAMSVAEKERLERIVQRLPKLVNRIALKTIPRVRKLEKERLS